MLPSTNQSVSPKSTYSDYGFTDSQQIYSNDYLLKAIAPLLDPRRNTCILDIGCGNGWIASELIQRGYNVYGTDASPTGIQYARQRYPDRFFLQDLTTDDLPDGLKHFHFDTIISTEVIEHLYNPLQFLAFCRRILTQNGHGELILSTPYHGYLKNLLLALSGKLDDHFVVLWEGGHIKFWSRRTLSAALEQEGFSVTQFLGCGRIPYVWKSMVIRSTLKSPAK